MDEKIKTSYLDANEFSEIDVTQYQDYKFIPSLNNEDIQFNNVNNTILESQLENTENSSIIEASSNVKNSEIIRNKPNENINYSLSYKYWVLLFHLL